MAHCRSPFSSLIGTQGIQHVRPLRWERALGIATVCRGRTLQEPWTVRPIKDYRTNTIIANMIIVSVIVAGLLLRRWPSLGRQTRSRLSPTTTLHSTGNSAKSTSSSASDTVHSHQHPTGIYIHIPFCRKRCRYCDFAIVPVGPDAALKQDYVDMARNYTAAVLTELRRVPRDKPVDVSSVYFGGGTPSLAPIEMLGALTEALQSLSAFRIASNVEWTIEIDPGTFDREKLGRLKDLGFNRFSLGVQSFNDTLLEYLGRTHREKDIYDSINMLLEVFGDDVNYSVDLISALPGLSLAQWTETLHRATSLHPRPKHISIYDLQIESGTVFGRWYGDTDGIGDYLPSGRSQRASQRNPLPTDADAAFMYRYTSGYLAALGYEHYEVSSYALRANSGDNHSSPWRSRHNQIYWAVDGQWYAFGMGATSFVDGVLQARPRALHDYIAWIGRGDRWTSDNLMREDELSTEPTDLDWLQDIVLKRLRTAEGLNLDWIDGRFGGKTVVDAILKGASLGLEMGLVVKDGPWLKLRDPDGLLFSNTIISSIFVELEDCFAV